MDLKKFFTPQSIALVGASSKEGTIGNAMTKNLRNYSGKVFLVNPKYDRISGEICYSSLNEIKESVDLAIIAIPAESAIAEIEKNSLKIKNYVVISAGFSEIGLEGEKRENRLFELAEKQNLNILGPNCLGFIIPKIKLNASFAGGMPQSGKTAFLTQSGALAVAFLDLAKKENIGFSKIISIGNKIKIDEADLLDYLKGDEDTKLVAMYLESVKDGEKFKRSAWEFSQVKPLIVLKAGKNQKTREAILSHTGALAGSDEIVSAVFKKIGIWRADNWQELVESINLIDKCEIVPGLETVVITNAGGMGVLTADAFKNKSLKLANIGKNLEQKLKKELPAEASWRNPIDLLGDADEDRYDKILRIIFSEEKIKTVVCVLTPQEQTPVDKIADKIISFKKENKKTLATVFAGGERIEKAVQKMSESGIPNFNFPDSAVKALNGYYEWKNAFRFEKTEFNFNAKRKEKVSAIIKKAKKEKRSALFFSEAEEVLFLYGIKVSEFWNIYPDFREKIVLQKNKINFPAVLKTDSDKILHKTDKAGVILNINNASQLNEAIKKMRFNFGSCRLIAQPMFPQGTEIIVGLKKDPIFGPVILYGLGGIYTEFFKIFDYLIPPAGCREIEENLLQGSIGFLFKSAREQANYKISDLVDFLTGISWLVLENPAIKEFDINPLIMYNDGKSPEIVDVKFLI